MRILKFVNIISNSLLLNRYIRRFFLMPALKWIGQVSLKLWDSCHPLFFINFFRSGPNSILQQKLIKHIRINFYKLHLNKLLIYFSQDIIVIAFFIYLGRKKCIKLNNFIYSSDGYFYKLILTIDEKMSKFFFVLSLELIFSGVHHL